jgi:hypothetical protein
LSNKIQGEVNQGKKNATQRVALNPHQRRRVEETNLNRSAETLIAVRTIHILNHHQANGKKNCAAQHHFIYE